MGSCILGARIAVKYLEKQEIMKQSLDLHLYLFSNQKNDLLLFFFFFRKPNEINILTHLLA